MIVNVIGIKKSVALMPKPQLVVNLDIKLANNSILVFLYFNCLQEGNTDSKRPDSGTPFFRLQLSVIFFLHSSITLIQSSWATDNWISNSCNV